jgi:hypothetical protein
MHKRGWSLIFSFLLLFCLLQLLPLQVYAQNYYLKVYFSSAVINGVTLSASNPEIIIQPGATLEGYFEVRVENIQPGSWITPVIGTASWMRRQFSCIADWAPTGISNQRYTFRITAPNTPGTYYIGIFTGWMYTCDEVASNDHPPNYDDGDDVWDMSSQRWEEVIRNGQASAGPYQMPGRAVRIVVQQNYYLRVRLDSATLNSQGLSTSNPELRVNPGSRITGTITFTVENVQPGSWITPVIWVTSWERGTVSNGRVRVVADDIRSTRQFTISIDVTAPSNPGTYYIGFFTGWMYSADEVASNDHPPNYGDGDDVWDMPGQGWEEVIGNGQASTGPYRMPGRAVRIVVQQQQQLSIDVWTNKGGQGRGNLNGGQYVIGESITLYCSVNTSVDSLKIKVIRPDGVELTALERGPSPAGTYQASGTAGEPAGERRVICETRLGGQSSSDEVRFTVVPPSDTTPPTVRVIAPNGGERLSPGSVFRIRWEASDNVGVSKVHIWLFQGNTQVMVVARDLPNTGYYDWSVPDRPGTNYRIRIAAVDAAGNAGSDDSDGAFEIVGAVATVILQVGIRHTYIGDLRIWVGVEGGREVLIWNREGGGAQNLFREWDLLQLGFTVNDLPPSESRRWYLRIRDEAGWDEGRLEYFRIICQGQTYESQDHPEVKDYQEVRAWIPSRGITSPLLWVQIINPWAVKTGVTSQQEWIGDVTLVGPREIEVGQTYEYKLYISVHQGPATGINYYIFGIKEKPGVATIFIPEELDWQFDPNRDFSYPGISWQSRTLDWLRQYIGWAARALITSIASALGGPVAGLITGFGIYVIGASIQDSAQALYDVRLGEVIEAPNNDPTKSDAVVVTWMEQGNTQGPIVITLYVTPTEYARGKEFKLGVSVDLWIGGWQRDLHYLITGNSYSIRVS